MLCVVPQDGKPIFYLLERVNAGGKTQAFVYIGSAPAFSQAPEFDAVVATGSTSSQTLAKPCRLSAGKRSLTCLNLQERSTELAQGGKNIPCAVYTDLEGFKQVKQLTDEALMDVVEAGVVLV